MKKFGIPMRIDEELEIMLRQIAQKNKISIRQASRELARINRQKKGKTFIVTDEIQF